MVERVTPAFMMDVRWPRNARLIVQALGSVILDMTKMKASLKKRERKSYLFGSVMFVN